MSRLILSRGGALEKPRRQPKFEPYQIDPDMRRGYLRIVVLYEHDGYYQLLIDGRRADLVTFEGRLHWNDARGPLVDDVRLLLSLREQMLLTWCCLRHNFAAAWNGAGVIE